MMIRMHFLLLTILFMADLPSAEDENLARGIRGNGEMINGEKEGMWIYRNEDGRPVIIGNHKNGVPNGAWCEFHSNGSLERIGIYHDGFPDGEWILFHDNGNIDSRGFFKNKKRSGTWRSYDPKGNLVGTINHDL